MFKHFLVILFVCSASFESRASFTSSVKKGAQNANQLTLGIKVMRQSTKDKMHKVCDKTGLKFLCNALFGKYKKAGDYAKLKDVMNGEKEACLAAAKASTGSNQNFDCSKMDAYGKNIDIENNNTAKEMGIDFDPKTNKIMDKETLKEFSIEDFSSPEAMEQAGLSKEEIAQITNAEKEIDAAASAAMGNEGGGNEGGGGGEQRANEVAAQSSTNSSAGNANSELSGGHGGAANSNNATNSPDPTYKSVNGNKSGKSPAKNEKVAGLFKNYNGDPIGVANDELFKMIQRRYKEVDNRENLTNARADKRDKE